MIALGDDILAKFRIDKARPNGRQIFVFAVIFPMFLFLCARTLTLGMSGRQRMRGIQTAEAVADRADITDRNGEILAKNIRTFDLVLNARKIEDPDKAANFVRGVFPDMSVPNILAKIKTGRGYIEIKKNIGKDKAAEIQKGRIEGVDIVRTEVRKYPKHNSMSHIVGFVYGNGDGADGMERITDERLTSDARPLELSIDSRIQSAVWTELSSAMKEYDAKSATGVIMDSRTGEIIAAVNLPDFDPESIGDYDMTNLRFRIMQDNYETGSIFKIFNTALALSNGIPATKTYNILDPFLVGGKRINEARGFRPPAKNLNVAQIMQYSSNSGSAQIALELPDGAQADFFRALNFDKALETDFGKTARPQFPASGTPTDRSRWSFGHGIAVTPLHVLLAANAIVMDGKYIMPTIYKRSYVPKTEQIISKETSRQIRQILFKVSDTSGKLAAQQVHGINIGGKTSTAQKVVNGQYSNTRNITAFYVAFPIEAPKWSMLIILDEPRAAPRTAAYNAVPTAGRILDTVIPMLE